MSERRDSLDAPGLLIPDWPAPPGVRAVSTLRSGGLSQGPWASLNLGLGVGDDDHRVLENRRHLREVLGLAREPGWLRQVHGSAVVDLACCVQALPEADASLARGPVGVCAVLTADCLPVLFCDRDARVVAAAHAGWRGLAAGVLEATIDAMGCAPERILAWLGPAIGPRAFEIGPEVRAVFLEHDPACAADFVPGQGDRWLADLQALARRRLMARGLQDIHACRACTFSEPERFFSYRRDGRTGRMASLIWLEEP